VPFGEEVFRYFLAIERKRSERSGRSPLLLLLDIQWQTGVSSRLHPSIARMLFAALRRSLRETDLIGWYRDEEVVAAILTQFTHEPLRDASEAIVQRVRRALRDSVPPAVERQLSLGAYQLPPRVNR